MKPAKPPSRKDLPRHIAVIMDGNGRWAKARGLSRIRGHERGADTVRDITRACAEMGIERLTLYAFSAENWKRPKREINALMRLLARFLVQERGEIMDNDIRFSAIGRLGELPEKVRLRLDENFEMSAKNKGMTLCLALNYGGRQEIADAARRLAEEVAAGKLDPTDVDEAAVGARLYAPQAPEPDLLIRTAGEMRVSNFLLWEISYAELWVTDVLWPDFSREDLRLAIEQYRDRERRFGGVR